MIYIAKYGERLDQVCYRFYSRLDKAYLPFLEAQSPALLSKGELDAGDLVNLPDIVIPDNDTRGDPWAI
jgi:phage tail protein X